MSKIIPIDLFDPVDIIMNVDPDVEKLVDSIDANDDDYDTLYAGIKINESSEDDDENDDEDYCGDDDDEECEDDEDIYDDDDVDIDTYDAIDDDSTDYLDMAADDIIDNYEDDDDDGELIDMVIAGIGPDEIN